MWKNHPPWGGFSGAFHGPPPDGGASRRVGRRCRGGARRDRPLIGSRPRPPAGGEGGDEIEFSRDLCVCICKKVVCVRLSVLT